MSRNVIAVVDDLFESVDPETWERVGHDPVRLLGEVGSDRMLALAKDRRLLRRLQDAHDDLQDYLDQPRWYQTLHDVPLVGFFSHVQTELQRQAQEAGYDRVLPRSVFTRDLADILASQEI